MVTVAHSHKTAFFDSPGSRHASKAQLIGCIYSGLFMSNTAQTRDGSKHDNQTCVSVTVKSSAIVLA